MENNELRMEIVPLNAEQINQEIEKLKRIRDSIRNDPALKQDALDLAKIIENLEARRMEKQN